MLDLYRENIIEHSKNPRNYGSISEPTFRHRELNPICGDELIVTGKVNEHDLVTEIKFTGGGCAVSQAAMSMLTEKIKEKTVSEIMELNSKDITLMLGIPISPTRLKCAELGLKAIKKGITQYGGIIC